MIRNMHPNESLHVTCDALRRACLKTNGMPQEISGLIQLIDTQAPGDPNAQALKAYQNQSSYNTSDLKKISELAGKLAQHIPRVSNHSLSEEDRQRYQEANRLKPNRLSESKENAPFAQSEESTLMKAIQLSQLILLKEAQNQGTPRGPRRNNRTPPPLRKERLSPEGGWSLKQTPRTPFRPVNPPLAGPIFAPRPASKAISDAISKEDWKGLEAHINEGLLDHLSDTDLSDFINNLKRKEAPNELIEAFETYLLEIPSSE